MYFDPTSLSAAYWHNPRIRERDEKQIASLLAAGDVFIDVGANIGALTLRAATIVGERGSVYSIEAHPVTFKYLTRNVRLNESHNIHLFNTAVGLEKGVIRFTSKLFDDQNQVSREDGIQVNCTTLDDLLEPGLERVTLLKVDVEGFEKFILQGAPKLLQKTRFVYFESSEEHFARFDYSTPDLIGVLMNSGFTVYRPLGEELVPVPHQYVSSELEDLVAARADDPRIAVAGLQGRR